MVDAPTGYDQGFGKVPFENVLYIKHNFNQNEPVFYASIAHPKTFIPQGKFLELCKYKFLVPEEVEFIIEDVFGVNDFKLDNNSNTPIYIQDIKIDVLESKGDLTNVCQFIHFQELIIMTIGWKLLKIQKKEFFPIYHNVN